MNGPAKFSAPPLLVDLLTRGDFIEVRMGRLLIEPNSGKPVPEDWMKANGHSLLEQIAKATAIPVYQYLRYTTGNYSEYNAAGVTLHYESVSDSETPRLTFNADLTRARTTNAGKSGEKLPKGKFRVKPTYSFPKFWRSLGLPPPARNSAYHDCMGKLKTVYVTGHCEHLAKSEKLAKGSVRPLEIRHRQLLKAFNFSDKEPAIPRQLSDNSPTTIPDKEPLESCVIIGFKPDLCTGHSKYGERTQGTRIKGEPITPIEDQTIEEWLDDYTSNTTIQ